MKCLISSLLVLSLMGCQPKPVTIVPGLDRVVTVKEFLDQPAQRERVFAFCGNDPGRTRGDPNCVNARNAVRIAFVGPAYFPHMVP